MVTDVRLYSKNENKYHFLENDVRAQYFSENPAGCKYIGCIFWLNRFVWIWIITVGCVITVIIELCIFKISKLNFAVIMNDDTVIDNVIDSPAGRPRQYMHVCLHRYPSCMGHAPMPVARTFVCLPKSLINTIKSSIRWASHSYRLHLLT